MCMNEFDAEMDYGRWRRIVATTQLVLVVLIFIFDVLNVAALYAAGLQGDASGMVAGELWPRFFLATVFNVGVLVAGQLIVRCFANVRVQKVTLLLAMELICASVAFFHYPFTIVFAVFLIPMILSILYEDEKLLEWSLAASLVGLAIAVAARSADPAYNQEILSEIIITFAIVVACYVVLKIVVKTMKSHSNRLHEAMTKIEEAKRNEELANVTVRIMDTLAQTIDAKDKYTNGHSFRVSVYSVRLARALGFGDKEVEALRCDALLHDIGKIGIPDSILNKPGELTDVEFNVIKSHAVVGAEILKDLAILPEAAAVAGGHHERFDGTGYPNGTKGREIPPYGRIVAIADAYDAMNSDRVYRKALDKKTIREQLLLGRGTQFDPEYLDVFIGLLDKGMLDISLEDRTHNLASMSRAVSNDIALFVENLQQNENSLGAFSISPEEFRQIFAYTKQLERRYKSSFELIVISAEGNSGKISRQDARTSFEALEVAIRKNIRTVDVHTKFSDRQHLVLLTNAGDENVGLIMRRISDDFEKLDSSGKFRLVYDFKKEV